MIVGRITFCDFCGRACLPDDYTTVHLDILGVRYAFSYHNTVGSPCLKHKIEDLRRKFNAPHA